MSSQAQAAAHAESLSEQEQDWSRWIGTHTAQHTACLVPADYGLGRIARFLGERQEAAHRLALEGADAEADRDIPRAMKLYAAAYRQWPSLDSCISGGIPVDVRAEALSAGYLNKVGNVLLDIVDVPKARRSKAVRSATPVLTEADIIDLLQIQRQLLSNESAVENNPENQRHAHKQACMMNNPPHFTLLNQKPSIVGKILQFAQQACAEGEWSSPGGPLEDVATNTNSSNILQGLSIRVIELWEYSIGGGLTDPYHYDTDSVLTIVTLLSNQEDFEGGAFRTFEVGGTHKSYDSMRKGDSVAFVSHKYHNITELTTGCRRSLVMELWQGGVGHQGR